ncbi:gamma-glutamylcyclotransferase [Streptomyces bohaiensis]|uniref:Putative gamma-glutamylcyclotransferase n=1 Tax=Streptomyces bohaiensis TaxID=1431344 RepID=A0ABX1C8R6_9ACTN|nr:gamma-glutamylcyclotransferase [Streptomyces bohaiensis]
MAQGRLAEGPRSLFVYGTLQFESVLIGLLGRLPDRTAAAAPGWRAASLEGRAYPGLVLAPGVTAEGFVLTDLGPREWLVIDAFEDDEYDLGRIILASGEETWSYLWRGEELRGDDWDAETFRQEHLGVYAARCARLGPLLAQDARA